MFRILIALFIPLLMLVSCGDDDSGKSPVQSEFGESSSGEVDSSSSDKVTEPAEGESSSSSKKIALSSSTPRSDKKSSSSSSKEKKSSSSGKVETSSSKKSSSSSSTPRKDNKSSSSSVKNPEPGEGSSSSESSSSGIVTQNSSSSSENPGPIENSSSSEESSSSLNPVESSSSEMSSSSSPVLNSIYDAENNTLTDLRDNHVYKTVTIGTQVWMAQNIDYLPEDTVGTKYGGLTICGGGESGTAIEGDCSVHGRLYERRVLIDSKGDGRVVCPDGWKVPSLGDWKILIDFLGGESIAGKKMKLNDNSMWGENMVHTNESGFSATLTGFFYFLGTFNQGVSSKYRQTSMLIYPVDGVEVKTKTIYTDEDSIKDDGFGPNYGISVRCIKK